MKVLYSEWMQELDKTAIQNIKIPSIVLMENASQGASRFFIDEFPLPTYSHGFIIIGKGNNGGDGIAVGRILHQKGYRISFIFLTDPRNLPPDSKTNYQIIENLNLPIFKLEKASELEDLLKPHSPAHSFIVDAIFGTGLTEAVRPGLFQEVIEFLNQTEYPIASIDIPSGLSEKFPPQSGIHIQADCTATFQSLKLAHITPDGNKFCGKIKIIDIGIPQELMTQDRYYINLIKPANFNDLFSPRTVDSHKGDFGHCFNISGSPEKPGAGILSAYAALKTGAGLCTSAVKKENRKIYIQAHPELMEFLFTSPNDLEAVQNNFDSVLIGPGLGQDKSIFEIVSNALLLLKVPLVLDADALNVLSNRLSVLKQKRKCPLILTPHPGEFSRLTGLSVKEIRNNRIEISRSFSMEHQLYLILKGHQTIISTPNGNIYINQTGNPGMATAGSGDVLSGMIAGFLAQLKDVSKIAAALQAAVFIHGFAGDLAAAELTQFSLTAGDLLKTIPKALKEKHEYTSNIQLS